MIIFITFTSISLSNGANLVFSKNELQQENAFPLLLIRVTTLMGLNLAVLVDSELVVCPFKYFKETMQKVEKRHKILDKIKSWRKQVQFCLRLWDLVHCAPFEIFI